MSLDPRPGQQGDGFPPAHGGYPDAKPTVTTRAEARVLFESAYASVAQLPLGCTGRITGRGSAGGVIIGHDRPCPVHLFVRTAP